MQIDGRHTYDAPYDVVWAMLADADVMRARYEGLGHRDVEILETTGDASSERLVMKVHRVVDIDLPDIAKKVLKPTAVCIQTDEWWPADDGHDGTFDVETKGQPVQIRGETKVRPGPDGTTLFEVTVDVAVKVPLIGGKISGIMRGDAEKLMQDEFAWNDQRLAEITGS